MTFSNVINLERVKTVLSKFTGRGRLDVRCVIIEKPWEDAGDAVFLVFEW